MPRRFTRTPAPQSATVSPPAVQVERGATQQFTATVWPDTADQDGFWYSSAPDVLAIHPRSGLAEWRSDGTATVTFHPNGADQVTATATVTTVTPASAIPASIWLEPSDPQEWSVEQGATRQLTATPLDADEVELTGLTEAWVSSNTGVATVNATTGLVTAVAQGSCTITVTIGGVSASRTFRVLDADPVQAYIDDMNVLGADVLAVFLAADYPDGSTSAVTPQLAPRYRKAGLGLGDIPDMILRGNAVKATRNGKAVVRYTASGGWWETTGTGSQLRHDYGITLWYIGTAQSASGAPVGIQLGAAGGSDAESMALVTDTTLHNRAHPSLAALPSTASVRYHMRCSLDSELRSWGLSAAIKRIDDAGQRYTVTRSADHVQMERREFVAGRNFMEDDASDAIGLGSSLYLVCGVIGSKQSAAEDIGAIVICRNPQTAAQAVRTQRFAVEQCGAYEETAQRVVFLGDSLNHGIATGRTVGADTYTSATADGAHAALQTAIRGIAGMADAVLTNAAFGGESCWSSMADRRDLYAPLFCNARTRARVTVVLGGPPNDLSPNTNYKEHRGAAFMWENLKDFIAFLRTLPGDIRIVLPTVLPCWVNGLTSPTHESHVRRLELNALIREYGPDLVDLVVDLTTNPTIGETGDNANATHYSDLTHLTDGGGVSVNGTGYEIPRAIYVTALPLLDA